ncbi:MAG: histidine phosphatase family protein [Clostridia bacterium]|nr:histidine phosphatase family protein [Clostridia bacterium]
MKLYVFRHGQTTHNLHGWHQGWGPIGLTELGFEQAAKTRELIDGIRFDAVYASDLLRARQTAEVIFPDWYREGRIHFDENLREIDTGAFYKMTRDDLYKRYGFGEAYDQHRRMMDYAPFGAEGSAAVLARARAFLDEMEVLAPKSAKAVDLEGANPLAVSAADGPEKIAVVTHGGIVRALATCIAGMPEGTQLGHIPLLISNCSVSVFSYNSKSGWLIEQLNYTGGLK